MTNENSRRLRSLIEFHGADIVLAEMASILTLFGCSDAAYICSRAATRIEKLGDVVISNYTEEPS